MRLGDIVDELHNYYGLAHTSAAEESDFATLCVRRKQIDDLNAGDQDLRLGRLLGIRRRGLMNRATHARAEGTQFVHWLTNDVDDAAKTLFANWDRDRASGVENRLTAYEAIGNVHCNAANSILPKLLRYLEDKAVTPIIGFKRIENFR
jgi:hypothetical protein